MLEHKLYLKDTEEETAEFLYSKFLQSFLLHFFISINLLVFLLSKK